MERFEIYPFARHSPQSRKRALVVGLIATVLIAVVLGVIGSPMSTTKTPNNILDLEFAGDARTTQAVFDAWGAAGVRAATTQTFVDFAYLAVYGPTIALAVGLSVWVWARRSALFGWLGVLLSWGGLAAAGLDLVENIAMLIQLSGGPNDTLAALARVCAGAKFGIILAAMCYALLAAGLWFGDGIIGVGKLWYRHVVDQPDNAPPSSSSSSVASSASSAASAASSSSSSKST